MTNSQKSRFIREGRALEKELDDGIRLLDKELANAKAKLGTGYLNPDSFKGKDEEKDKIEASRCCLEAVRKKRDLVNTRNKVTQKVSQLMVVKTRG